MPCHLSDWRVKEIHAVYPSPKLGPQKVMTFIAFLQGRFDGRWWEALPKE